MKKNRQVVVEDMDELVEVINYNNHFIMKALNKQNRINRRLTLVTSVCLAYILVTEYKKKKEKESEGE